MRGAHSLTLGALIALAVAIALATQPGVALADSAAPSPGGYPAFNWMAWPAIALCAAIVVAILVVALIRRLILNRRKGEKPPENRGGNPRGWDFRM